MKRVIFDSLQPTKLWCFDTSMHLSPALQHRFPHPGMYGTVHWLWLVYGGWHAPLSGTEVCRAAGMPAGGGGHMYMYMYTHTRKLCQQSIHVLVCICIVLCTYMNTCTYLYSAIHCPVCNVFQNCWENLWEVTTNQHTTAKPWTFKCCKTAHVSVHIFNAGWNIYLTML